MNRLLHILLRGFIRSGNLQISTATGATLALGDRVGKSVAIRFATRAAERAVMLDPELKFGEAYVNGDIVVEQGSIADVLDIVFGQRQPPHWARIHWFIRYACRRLHQLNSRYRAWRNAAHHYDLNHEFYQLFLDTDGQYSCAYFESSSQSLDDAQLAKKRHLAAKLLVRPRQRVLDIGCGWGGLALYLAQVCQAYVTGITLSTEQLTVARRRAAGLGLSQDVQFQFQDYRDTAARFDRIVSVGMFEHVGVGFYDLFFRKCAALLDDDGITLLSSIGRSDGPNVTNPWIEKYIFPGGYIPALSEVVPAVERAGLLITDVEILRLHYAETLKDWRERFLAHHETVDQLYDKRFERMWEFYLAASEMAFRCGTMMVFQLQLTRRQGVVPTTRDYIAQESASLRALEKKQWRRSIPERQNGRVHRDTAGPSIVSRAGSSPN